VLAFHFYEGDLTFISSDLVVTLEENPGSDMTYIVWRVELVGMWALATVKQTVCP
jgi:hypothetical protein